MSEKIQVEFGVEKSEEKGYGYVEKYLLYNNQKIPYKAVLKDGNVMAIVHRGYKLIPHELVKRYLEIHELKEIEDTRVFGRMYLRYKVVDKSDFEILVVNSVDASHSLIVSMLFTVNGKRVWVSGKSRALSVAKMIHKKNAKVNELANIVRELIGKAEIIRDAYLRVFSLKAGEHMDVWKALCDLIPEKYTRQIMAKLTYDRNKELTVGDVYGAISTGIWNADTDMRTKMTFLQRLDEVVWIIGETGGAA